TINIAICNLFYYSVFIFFFNDPATTEIYTLSLHDALPISGADERRRRARLLQRRSAAGRAGDPGRAPARGVLLRRDRAVPRGGEDRKSTRLNSSHLVISYAVFCLKKKKK